jgi:hypothetical protein
MERLYKNQSAFKILMAWVLLIILSNKTSAYNGAIGSSKTGANLLLDNSHDNSPNQFLMLKLSKDAINSDETMIRFKKTAHNNYNRSEDAIYFQGMGGVSLASFSSDNIQMAINEMPLPKLSPLSIGLMVLAKTDGIYKLQMVNISEIPQLYDIWLMDAYKQDSLDMRHNSTYLFNVYKKDTSTFGNNRFRLVIRQNAAFAYRLLNFTAIKSTSSVQLVWSAENEADYTSFTVERSNNGGVTFSPIDSVASDGTGVYSFTDSNPLATGKNLYRLKQVDINSTTAYSNILAISYGDGNNHNSSMAVYPNPASGTINLSIPQGPRNTANYNILITNSSGSPILNTVSTQRQWQTGIDQLLPGSYIITVVDNKDRSLVGRAKFVKTGMR